MWQEHLDQAIEGQAKSLIQLRRHLHSHPEISGQEFQTTSYLLDLLREIGCDCRVPTAKRGIVAQLGDAGVPRIALRADLDALQIQDVKDVAYRSRNDGVMHACGHDAHCAILVGALQGLQQLSKVGQLPWPISVCGIFQPAEETATGAKEMVHFGALNGVDAILGVHVDPKRKLGVIGLRNGVSTANCDEIRVHLRGVGGHAARPHEAVDPLSAAAQLVQAIYLQVPRSTNSQDAVVVTFGRISGGQNSNVIPDSVELRGTLRTLSDAVRIQTQKKLSELCRGVSATTGVAIDLEIKTEIDSVVNDPNLNQILRTAAIEVLEGNKVETITRSSMGSEDFSVYLKDIPGAMFRLGTATEERETHLHSSDFDIAEEAIVVAAKILARSAVLWSDPKKIDDCRSVAGELAE
ncbi:MAG: amidohydrolase [Planctomycetota bacterium]|nr:amidohydrolase [Planctomycetota bacterium]